MNILETDISEIIGLTPLPEDEKIVLLRDLGELVLESALLRLVADLTPEQSAALDQYSDTVTDSEMLIKHLFEHYPRFEIILNEEIKAFKEEAMAGMSAKK